MAKGHFRQPSFSRLHLERSPLKSIGVFGVDGNYPIKGRRSVQRSYRARNNIYLLHVQFGGAQEIPQRKVQTGCLIVYPVDYLKAANRAGAVETAGVDDLKTNTG